VLAGLFAAVAAGTAVAISVLARTRDLAVLRTLGLRLGQGGAMTAVEQLPALAIAGVGGVVVGAVTARLLRAALGLARFAGSGRPVGIRSDPFATLTTAGLVTIAIALAVAISIRLQRRRDLAATLRAGDTT
jgi:putative ABC transport system permease protein